MWCVQLIFAFRLTFNQTKQSSSNHAPCSASLLGVRIRQFHFVPQHLQEKGATSGIQEATEVAANSTKHLSHCQGLGMSKNTWNMWELWSAAACWEDFLFTLLYIYVPSKQFQTSLLRSSCSTSWIVSRRVLDVKKPKQTDDSNQ